VSAVYLTYGVKCLQAIYGTEIAVAIFSAVLESRTSRHLVEYSIVVK
jgi:hypothetical protein